MSKAEAKQFAERAQNLRVEGRLEEAILAARRATTLDADNANAWWQLALSQEAKDGADTALPALLKVTELAPDFPGGWNELGRSHYRAKRYDEALEAYEQALEADSSHISSMRAVAYLLKGRKEEGVIARRLALLRAVYEKDQLDDEDTFDLAYLLGEADETAESVKVYEHFTREHDGEAAFYNLALGYQALDRDADALDALEAARRTGYKSEKLTTVHSSVQKRLLALREQVVRRPQPYLPQSEWFRHYINPFTLLDVEPIDVENNPKALQKAKQALMREIELEDGKVDWLPGLVIDKSTAMATLAELDNADAWSAHQLVFHDGALNNFLMRGALHHFLIHEDGTTDCTLPHLLEAETLERIGPKFAAQYADVLGRAVEQGDLVAVECLMDGRRWVTTAQLDACFESTKRLVTRLSEPLMEIAEISATRSVSRPEIEKAFNQGNLGSLLALLPIEFYEVHSAVGIALRGLSVSYYNREHDAEGAKAILALGRACAKKSPALAQQMQADEKTLDGFIVEEKSKEAHLSFKDRNVSITKAGVAYGKQKLAPADIVGLRWGLVQTSAQPPIYRLTVAFEARQGEDIVVSWSTSNNLEEQQKYWAELVEATTSFILGTVVENVQAELKRDQSMRIGPLLVFEDGVELTAKGWFSHKKIRVPWARLSSTMVNGSVVLRDAQNPKATAELPAESTYNAFLLPILANLKERARS
jgi:tetratricopeptide (TPR) repeat protein